MPRLARTALVFPPLWYYTSVPGDLIETGSALRAAGAPLEAFALSAGLTHPLLGDNPGYLALRRRETYADADAYDRATADLATACSMLGMAFGARVDSPIPIFRSVRPHRILNGRG